MQRQPFKNLGFWLIAFIGVLIDYLSKRWVLAHFSLGQTQPIIPNVFHFTYVTNTGAAFSLFEGSDWLKWLSLAVSLGLMAVALSGPHLSLWEQLGYGCILSGAVGNGIDRFLWGEVVDFLHLPIIPFINFPIFNLADVAINIGIICLLILAWRQPEPEP
ncbi:MAG: lipoprotein signal peptidase [Phormidium sp. SL48-SHIP]|nr:MAG: lipoprotein signal peptidase [Phormidium sp. SL48-SHIP]